MELVRSQDVARKASKFPRIPGSAITGEVVELGDGVDQWYASTQICSSCGEKGQKKTMDVNVPVVRIMTETSTQASIC